jgi:hypothetical protein
MRATRSRFHILPHPHDDVIASANNPSWGEIFWFTQRKSMRRADAAYDVGVLLQGVTIP